MPINGHILSIKGEAGNVKELELSIGTIFIPGSTDCILKGKVTFYGQMK